MKIYITEEQQNKLFEAMMSNFRLDYLSACGSYAKRVKYCKEMLGNPIGNGSSRMVFQIDDETCLKLAKNKKGIEQNLEEMSIVRDNFLTYVPKVYNGSDEENGLWIITQYVIPAKEKDFEQVLGIPFRDIEKFARSTDDRFDYGSRHMQYGDEMVHHLYKKYEDNEDVISLFNDMSDLKANYNQLVSDLAQIQNWGMVRENGSTYLVMLDTGISEEIYNQYYRRRF